jgi:hypothetical protein
MQSMQEQLLAKLECARIDRVEGSGMKTRLVTVPSRNGTPPLAGSLLDRIRAKAHAPAKKDLGSMLNRHKENVHVN